VSARRMATVRGAWRGKPTEGCQTPTSLLHLGPLPQVHAVQLLRARLHLRCDLIHEGLQAPNRHAQTCSRERDVEQHLHRQLPGATGGAVDDGHNQAVGGGRAVTALAERHKDAREILPRLSEGSDVPVCAGSGHSQNVPGDGCSGVLGS